MLYLCGIVFFLLLNAFFVASEFAIVKVRPSQIEAQAKDQGRNPKLALHVVNHLDGYLSANQLGITISSLALGFLGEPFVKALVYPLLAYTGMPDKGIYWTSLILAYSSRSPSSMWWSASWCPSRSPSASRWPSPWPWSARSTCFSSASNG